MILIIFNLLFNYVTIRNCKRKASLFFKYLNLKYVYGFSGFFPVAINFLRRVPVIGTLLNIPGISGVSMKICINKNN